MLKYPPQRYVYKINSARIRKAKWNLDIKIEEAIDRNELIALTESTVIRFIDKIKNTNTEEIYKYLKVKNSKIKKLKYEKASVENSSKINKLYREKYEKLLIKDYICIVINSSKDFDRLNSEDGFKVNGVTYKHLVGTPNGIKTRTVVYVNEDILEELERRIDNGRDLSMKFIPAKLEAYKALVCSASLPVSNPNRILVVEDCVTKFTANVIKVDDTQSDYPVVSYEENYPIELEDSDGYGLISPRFSKQWFQEISIDGEDDYIPSGYCVRMAFCKGMLFCADFHAFAEEVAGEYIVTDIWGDKVDIREVDIILTTSMLKLWKSYKNLDNYLENCNKNGYAFSITKCILNELENERSLNYQFIQSLYMDDEDIENLVSPTIEEMNDVLGLDYRKSILFLRGTYLDDIDFKQEQADFIKALMIDEEMINDPFVRDNIYKIIRKRIDSAKIGVLKTKGNYSVVSGDVYSLCQSIFKMEVTGLLRKGEFYSRYWLDKGVNKVACFRAPMTCHNNIKILNLVDENKWYKYMKAVTIFNSWDTTAHALNGLDKDGDTVFTTNNSNILGSIREVPAIFCVQKSAEKILPNKEDLIQSNKNGFGDEIGVTTNHITTMFDVLAKFKEGSPEYKEIMKRIMCGQNYQQNAIDKVKGIESKSMPEEWYMYNKNIDDFGKSIVANKKPYFFTYIYPQRKAKYNNFVKKANANCLMRFDVNIDELDSNINEHKEFLEHYNKMMPVSLTPSLMNKICWRIENEFQNVSNKFKKNFNFDKNILKSDVKYSQKKYGDIELLYQEYTKQIQQHMKNIAYKKADPKENRAKRQEFQSKFKNSAYYICSNRYELCNILIDLCYEGNRSKQFVWDICGDVIIDNLLARNNNIVSYPIFDECGDIEFNGDRFSMTEYEFEGSLIDADSVE